MTTQTKPDRADFLSCVVITAVEGGVNYWAAIKDYQWSKGEDDNFTSASAKVRDVENNGGEWHEVTHETVEAGIAKIRTGDVRLNKEILSWILTGDATNDATDIDATAADCIIQVALFDEVVYG